MPSKKATIVCPHCGTTYTITHGFETSSGGTSAQCPKCHKTCHIKIERGDVGMVTK